MWRTIQQQQREIETLRNRQKSTDKTVDETRKTVQETEKAVEATADAVEKTAGGKRGWWDRTSLGGYGELHYNGGDADELDFHRFVLFVGHEFNDRIRLFTEIELEHALAVDTADGSGPGEVELEQAYVEFDFNNYSNARAGLFLIPVGILNETHEPPTFYGIERNVVENRIIPTTWWEGGAGFAWFNMDGVRIDAAIHGGLDVPTAGGSAFLPRSGRQKVAQSTLRNPALTGRFRYTGIPGIELATTLNYQFDATQSDPGDPDTSALLWEAHVDATRKVADGVEVGLRALFARWHFDGAAPEALGRDVQYGWYVEPAAKVETPIGYLGAFGRYAQVDNNAGNSADTKFGQFTLGFNYWPHPDVVFKADYQIQQPPAGTAKDNRVNLGFGFQF